MLPTIMQDPLRLEMRSSLGEFLVADLIDIVDSYFAFSGATEVLTLGTDGQPADSETNREMIGAMKRALTDARCDRTIIRTIFNNAVDNGYTAFLNTVMHELRDEQQTIVLDHVDFSNLNLSGLNFDSASLQQANFTNATLHSASFLDADLSGAQGLSSANGLVAVNYRSILTGTGYPFASAYLYSVLRDHVFWIPLDGSTPLSSPAYYFHIKSSGTMIWIKHSDIL